MWFVALVLLLLAIYFLYSALRSRKHSTHRGYTDSTHVSSGSSSVPVPQADHRTEMATRTADQTDKPTDLRGTGRQPASPARTDSTSVAATVAATGAAVAATGAAVAGRFGNDQPATNDDIAGADNTLQPADPAIGNDKYPDVDEFEGSVASRIDRAADEWTLEQQSLTGQAADLPEDPIDASGETAGRFTTAGPAANTSAPTESINHTAVVSAADHRTEHADDRRTTEAERAGLSSKFSSFEATENNHRQGGGNNGAAAAAPTDPGNADLAGITRRYDADGKLRFLDQPDGQPDDLTRISGIGPVVSQGLNGMGIYHYHQIAAFSQQDIDAVNSELDFPGRIEREDWIGQARRLVTVSARSYPGDPPARPPRGETSNETLGDDRVGQAGNSDSDLTGSGRDSSGAATAGVALAGAAVAGAAHSAQYDTGYRQGGDILSLTGAWNTDLVVEIQEHLKVLNTRESDVPRLSMSLEEYRLIKAGDEEGFTRDRLRQILNAIRPLLVS